jgi:hypothetical protein
MENVCNLSHFFFIIRALIVVLPNVLKRVLGRVYYGTPCLNLPCSPFKPESFTSSSVIQEVEHLRDMGLALMTYFYCDFRDPNKQEVSDLLVSLVAQLSARSDACYSIFSSLYSEYDAGSRRPSDNVLMDCLEKMLKSEGQPTIYIIIDALDESPDSLDVVSARKRILDMVQKLVNLQLTNVRTCATSRPEADIQAALTSLASHTVCLHDEEGQKKDIADYVRSIVYSDEDMQKWRTEDKDMVIDSLSQKADGM